MNEGLARAAYQSPGNVAMPISVPPPSVRARNKMMKKVGKMGKKGKGMPDMRDLQRLQNLMPR